MLECNQASVQVLSVPGAVWLFHLVGKHILLWVLTFPCHTPAVYPAPKVKYSATYFEGAP